jgi:hypothetical protein
VKVIYFSRRVFKMEEINIEYVVSTVTQEVKIATKTEITTWCVYTLAKMVNVDLAYMTSDNEILDTKSFQITGEKFDLLMSESPEFAIGKPKDDFRRADLRYVIDLIREEQNL